MKIPLPKNRTLGDSTRIRIYTTDEQVVKSLADKSFLSAAAIKRIGIHLGLPILAAKLGVKQSKKTSPYDQ